MISRRLNNMPLHSGDQVTFVNWRVIDHSSNVERVGWPVTGEPLILVQFHNGSIYGYLGGSRQLAVALARSKSVGEFLNKRIKPKYKAVRIRA